MSPSGETPDKKTFFGEEDYQHYLELMSQFCRAEQVAIWAYCLMPNHVHLIVVPQSAESLRRAIGEAHRRYTRRINVPAWHPRSISSRWKKAGQVSGLHAFARFGS